MNLKGISFMSEQSSPNKSDNHHFNMNTEDRDYKNLINRLEDISKTINLLEKTIVK